MSAKPKILDTTSAELQSPFWERESLLNGRVILHTIKGPKVVAQVKHSLEKQNYELTQQEKAQHLSITPKHPVTTTETQEIRIDNIRVTEGSIVSLTNSRGEKRTVKIDETAKPPLGSKALAAPLVQADFRHVEHERLVYKNEVARLKNSFFFRVTSGENLFKLGDSYFRDFKDGKKFFGFAQLSDRAAQQRSVLGVATFIHYYENVRILVVTDSLAGSYFASFLGSEHAATHAIGGEPEIRYEAFTHEGISYLSLADLQHAGASFAQKGMDYVLRQLFADYDLVLIDLPSLTQTREQTQLYFPLLQVLQSVTLVLHMRRDHFSEVDAARSYFENYQIPVKGLIIEGPARTKELR